MLNENIIKIEVEENKISIFESTNVSAPFVILHEYGDVKGYNVSNIWKICKKLNAPNFSLAVIPKNNQMWNDEMSPWEIPAISVGDTPCKGKADQYLSTLINKIVPSIEEKLSAKPKYIALAGYSLAGLFAIYTLYKTDTFDRIASASGSFWYPNFLEYVKNHSIKKVPEKLYLSLGDKECKSHEKILQSVQKNTEEMYNIFLKQKINAFFELNSGNHFQKTAERMAKGIIWMLTE